MGTEGSDGPLDEQSFRLLVESTRDYAIFMLDRQGYIRTWNLGAERIKGYSAGEIIGQHFSRFYPAHDIEAGKPAWELEVATREGKYEEEGWRLRKDGERFWASVLITALRDERGELRGFGKVTRDLTDRRRAEEERQQLLESERAARAEAERALRARDEFLSVAAHELKTPVTTLRGFAQIVLRQIGKTGTVEMPLLERALRTVDVQTQKLTRMVEQLLDVSRLEVGKLALERTPTDLVALVREVAERLATVVPEAPSRIRVVGPDSADGCAVAEVDPLRVEQVIVNLLTNALKFSYGKPGEIEVQVSCAAGGEASAVASGGRGSGGEVRIVVTDSGMGVPEEHRAHIFERYYQAHTEDHLSGLGLRLFVSREIALMHGGELRAEFPEGGGTRFVLALPAKATDATERVASAEAAG